MLEDRMLQTGLMPLRSWRRKNNRYHRILSDIRCELSIFLFSPDEDDLRITQPDGGDSTEDDSVVPKDGKRVYFLSADGGPMPPTGSEVYVHRDLNELVGYAWKRFRAEPADRFIEVSTTSDVYVGLARALTRTSPFALFSQKVSEPTLGIAFGQPGGATKRSF